MSLHYDMAVAGDVAEVALTDRIDRDAAPALDQAYRDAAEAGAIRLVLDFSRVEYINSTGIALIVGLLGKARADSREVLAQGLSPHYAHIFEITRLSDFITILDRSAP